MDMKRNLEVVHGAVVEPIRGGGRYVGAALE
jgi:hypothetical protein